MSINTLSPINQKLASNLISNNKTENNTVNNEPQKVDKKKLAVGIAAATGIAALVIGGIICLKSGKPQKIIHGVDTSDLPQVKQPNKSDIETAVDEVVDAVDDNLKKVFDDLNNPSALTDQGYSQTPVYIDKTSIQDDLSAWAEKRKDAVLEGSHYEKTYRYNISDKNHVLENIKPHNYDTTSDIFVQTRLPESGFPHSGFTVIDDKLTTFNGNYCTWSNIISEKDFCGYQAGIDKDGKACVMLRFFDSRQDHAGRSTMTAILLRSKNGTFNQDQLDLINMFQHLDRDEIAARGVANPLGLAFLVPKDDHDYINTKFEFNKNTFLSIIKHYADKHKDFIPEVTSGKIVERIIE